MLGLEFVFVKVAVHLVLDRVGESAHAPRDGPPRAHRHAELELNLVVRGSASYLLGERRYLTGDAITAATLLDTVQELRSAGAFR